MVKRLPRLKRLPAMQETWVRSMGREDPPGEGNGNPLQYPHLYNPMDRETWWATVYGVAKSWMWLHFHFHFQNTGWELDRSFPSGSDSEKSSCNAGDPGSVPRSGWSPWRRKWQPTLVFLPGKSHGWRSLVGYSPWGHKESEDMTERPLFFTFTFT